MQIGAVQQYDPGLAGLSGQSVAAIRDRLLRESINEFIGLAFYGPMFKMMRNSAIKGDFGHGGRGEEVFQAQLDMELASRAGKASQSSLSEAFYTRMKRASDAQHKTVSMNGQSTSVQPERMLRQLQGRDGIGVGGLL